MGITCEAKIKPVCNYIYKFLLETQHTKIIVVAYHKKMLNALKEMCEENDFNYVKIDGSSSLKDRTYQINSFNLNQNVKS